MHDAIRLLAAVLLALPLVLGGRTPPPVAVVFHVAPDGSASADGTTRASAFATVAQARDAVRALKQTGGLEAPVVVYLHDGRYEVTEPIVFTSEDSGTEAAPITYRAAPGATPVLTGARIITGWQDRGDGVWTTTLPEVAAGRWHFKRLYVNGEARPRTRLPETGFHRIVDFPNKDNDPWAAPSDHFTFAPSDIRADWTNRDDVEVVVLRFWVSTRQHIAGVDEQTNTVTFAYPTRYRYSDDFSTDGARYYVENVAEALDAPGEWYLDRPTGTLHYIPLPGEDLTTARVEAPAAPQLVRFEGDPAAGVFVEHLTLQGLTFTGNNWRLPPGNPGDGQSAPAVEGALALRGARHVTLEGNRLVNLTSYGIQIDEGCRANRFVGNELGYLDGGGVRMGGGDAASHPHLRTGGNVIADNRIHHIGQRYHAASGIWVQHSGGNTIAHNEIAYTYYSSIAIGWVWGYRPSVSTHNEVSYNHIHHVGQGMLSDIGGIYLLGVAPGTVVRNNLIHDVESHGYGGWGIYTDEGSSHVLIENNIVYRTKYAAFDQHYGKRNLVRNNIFALGREDLINRSRVEKHISFLVERNIFYWTGDTPLLAGRWHHIAYEHRPGKPWVDPEPDSLTYVFDYNLYFNPDKTRDEVRFAEWTFDAWQARGQDTHSRYADPLFADPAAGDFAIPPHSPALDLGFLPIDMSTVGPRDQPD